MALLPSGASLVPLVCVEDILGGQGRVDGERCEGSVTVFVELSRGTKGMKEM